MVMRTMPWRLASRLGRWRRRLRRRRRCAPLCSLALPNLAAAMATGPDAQMARGRAAAGVRGRGCTGRPGAGPLMDHSLCCTQRRCVCSAKCDVRRPGGARFRDLPLVPALDTWPSATQSASATDGPSLSSLRHRNLPDTLASAPAAATPAPYPTWLRCRRPWRPAAAPRWPPPAATDHPRPGSAARLPQCARRRPTAATPLACRRCGLSSPLPPT